MVEVFFEKQQCNNASKRAEEKHAFQFLESGMLTMQTVQFLVK